jgi:hypothetical protein
MGRGGARGLARGRGPPSSTVIYLNNYINIGIYSIKISISPIFLKYHDFG